MSGNGDARLGAGTIFKMADDADPRWRDRIREEERIEHQHTVQRLVDKMEAAEAGAADEADGEDAGDLTPLKTVSMADLAGRPIPERKWIVERLLPDRNVTDLSGDGGLGKSLLAQQLAAKMAGGGGTWLGHKTIAGAVLNISAEDELGEIQRRTLEIAKSEGMSLADLGNLHVADLTTGIDTELVMPDPENRQSVKPTPQLARLEARIATLRPKLVILDTRADMFGGSEIDRVQVRIFIRHLRRLCVSYDMAILLLSHPSRTGLTTGDGQSGSTAWGNSVRSRLYLKRDPDDPDLRVVTSEKSNYGPTSTEIRLRWENGAFRRVDTLIGGKVPDRQAMERHVDERFMRHLAEAELQGAYVNCNATGSNYAPRVFAKLDGPGPDRVGEKHYAGAMWRLRSAGLITIGKTPGPPSRQRDRLVAVDRTAPLKSLAERQGGAA